MRRSTQPVALTVTCVCGSPIRVVNAECRDISGTLLQHLRNHSVVQIEAVLNGVTSSVERAVQADAAVGMARNFLAPAVSLVDNRPQLFDGERGLRYEFAILAHPRPMRHIDLDPVGAMIQLLPRGFASLDGTVDNLHAFGHVELGSIALQRISARR